jgi:hypothetical protein
VKSGQITQLKMCARSAAIVSGSACTTIGRCRSPPTESTSSGSAAT